MTGVSSPEMLVWMNHVMILWLLASEKDRQFEDIREQMEMMVRPLLGEKEEAGVRNLDIERDLRVLTHLLDRYPQVS